MKCVVVKENGNVEKLRVTEMEIPKRDSGELLIKVHYTAVNRTDIINREGKAGKLVNPILGVEISGEVVETDENSSFKLGDRVMGLVNSGAYAEYCIIPEGMAIKLSEILTYEEGAAIPEVFLTAYQTLYWLGGLQENETVLIHAGASGVGTAAIQLAKKIGKAKVIVTAGSEEKLEFCKKLGADVVINYKEKEFDKIVLDVTQGKGVDLILDFVGASYWEKNLNSIKVDGRMVLIGILGGTEVEKMSILQLLMKRVQITGTLLTPRTVEYKTLLSQEFSQKVLPLIEKKIITPIIDRVFSIDEIKQAHTYMEENKNIGKIVIKIIE
ncbi:NAD(P)H-quinone oxidoreductase [Fusobacterium sp.]|uniref:NAD(P)H-quinone oxidoreductase n=1 Tax=Fusobacterium sp. TaxID=68766 RepID=UPI0026373064|nr:NAD(P)H-quinone oxidoreductase [Fusobacterium sp.]